MERGVTSVMVSTPNKWCLLRVNKLTLFVTPCVTTARVRREHISRRIYESFSQPFEWTHSLNNAHVTRYTLSKNGKRFLSHSRFGLNVCAARRPGWIRYKGIGSIVSSDDDRDTSKRIPGLAPETYLRRTIVSGRSVRSRREVVFRVGKLTRRERPHTLAASGEISSQDFSERCTRTAHRASSNGRETYFLPKRHVPPGIRALFSRATEKGQGAGRGDPCPPLLPDTGNARQE